MSYSPSFADELLHLMKGLGPVTTRKMFGALGFYRGPDIFACLMDGDVFYLKATGSLAEELRGNGSKPFIYEGKSGKTVNMPYMTAPSACLDDADEMILWCRKALAALPAKANPVARKAPKKVPKKAAKPKAR
jgi:DNA transformation protein